MKKILALGTLFLFLTMSAMASTQPVKHVQHVQTEQVGQRTIYSVTFNYCHYVGPRNEMECCTVTATYYWLGPVPIVTSGSSNCEYNRTPAPYDHSDAIPQTVKDGTLDDFTKYYIMTYGSAESTVIGDDGH